MVGLLRHFAKLVGPCWSIQTENRWSPGSETRAYQVDLVSLWNLWRCVAICCIWSGFWGYVPSSWPGRGAILAWCQLSGSPAASGGTQTRTSSFCIRCSFEQALKHPSQPKACMEDFQWDGLRQTDAFQHYGASEHYFSIVFADGRHLPMIRMIPRCHGFATL